MPERKQAITPYQGGARGNDYQKPEPRTPVRFNMSKSRNIGQPDPLSEAIKGRNSYIPGDFDRYSHSKTPKSRGAHYNPAGEEGRPHGKMMSKATDYTRHPGGRGENANGYSPPNTRGDNPLGRAMNKIGSNVLGRPSNRGGENAVGNRVPNTRGEKSGYGKFNPRGGGKNV
jgi:hypothetical protein